MKLFEQWRAMDARRRAGLSIGGGLILVFMAAASYFLLRPTYVPVFPDLSPQDGATLVAQLEINKTPYRVDKLTGTVTVPDDDVGKVRATLMGRGFPVKNAVGFELFDSGDFGMTEFTEKINYQRALEGELARTIMSLDSVRFARLHLVLPESSLFKRDRDPPKASVLLVTVGDRKVTSEQVAGIQRMVASAVPGLTPDLVSVHDHRGVNLAEASSDAGGPGGISAKEATEAYLSSKVFQMLGALYPKTAVAVSIDATLRSGRLTSTHESHSGPAPNLASPPKPKLAPMHEGMGDVPQVIDEALLSKPVAPATQREGISVEQRTEQSEEGPGQVERLSVAVIVPDPLPQNTTLDQIRDLVSAATGADPSRGDHVAVYSVNMPLRTLTFDDRLKVGDKPMRESAILAPDASVDANDGRWRPWMLFAALAMVILVLFALIGRRPGVGTDLSATERAELLAKVRRWLNEPDAPPVSKQ